jgi:hypothetical protein
MRALRSQIKTKNSLDVEDEQALAAAQRLIARDIERQAVKT